MKQAECKPIPGECPAAP